MPGFVLPSTVSMACPHGGQIVIPPPPPKVLANGGSAMTPKDLLQWSIVGCTSPAQCVKVAWVNLSARVKLYGQPILVQAPAPPPPLTPGNGTCSGAPPGPPLVNAMLGRVFAT